MQFEPQINTFSQHIESLPRKPRFWKIIFQKEAGKNEEKIWNNYGSVSVLWVNGKWGRGSKVATLVKRENKSGERHVVF